MGLLNECNTAVINWCQWKTRRISFIVITVLQDLAFNVGEKIRIISPCEVNNIRSSCLYLCRNHYTDQYGGVRFSLLL